MPLRSLLPLPPLSRYPARDLPADVVAAVGVCVLTVPQALAYATIAGLPPAMGLYAAAIPTIVGSLFRSSRHVIAGPTNALSLLVGAAVATGLGGDPVGVALTLALLVGVMQLAAGLLRLGSLVDYISGPVVLGYITGAGVLIGVGQLHNATGTSGPRGSLLATLEGWLPAISDASAIALGMTVGTIVVIFAIRALGRRLGQRFPGAITAMGLALGANMLLDLESHGLQVLSDLAPIPNGLPAPVLPDLSTVGVLLPVAVACTVLSLVESSAVARATASRTGQRLDASTEFAGQGLANIAAGLFGGYPISGSLARTALNERLGARSRIAGILSGLLMIGVLLSLGAVLDHTPIASLAGLLLVVAWDLLDRPRIVQTLRASRSDALAFVATTVATWTLSLDMAIYLGVGVSVVLFLRRARVLTLREMIVDDQGRWQECPLGQDCSPGRLPGVRVLQVEGPLFFGASGELVASLDAVLHTDGVHAVVLRLKRAQGMDVTIAHALAEAAQRAEADGRRLILVGLDDRMVGVLNRSGAAASFPTEHLIRMSPTRFAALGLACDIAEAFATEARQPSTVTPVPPAEAGDDA
ncbi:MAG: SulP family inorganic anion transporter [Deltaproteobacteria bacterium]|nr:SulP family inorganic anion transporter [Deltaproteobacteria bacterium]